MILQVAAGLISLFFPVQYAPFRPLDGFFRWHFETQFFKGKQIDGHYSPVQGW
jgi:hypothetical protein